MSYGELRLFPVEELGVPVAERAAIARRIFERTGAANENLDRTQIPFIAARLAAEAAATSVDNESSVDFPNPAA